MDLGVEHRRVEVVDDGLGRNDELRALFDHRPRRAEGDELDQAVVPYAIASRPLHGAVRQPAAGPVTETHSDDRAVAELAVRDDPNLPQDLHLWQRPQQAGRIRRGHNLEQPHAVGADPPTDFVLLGASPGKPRIFGLHLTETCGPGDVRLITDVATAAAAINDDRMAAVVHASLSQRELLPEEHWVDTGYANSPAMVAARRDYGVELHGPLQAVNSVQSSRSDGAYGQDAFTIDWDNERVTCPNGRTSRSWAVYSSQRRMPVLRVGFSVLDCRPCPHRRDCLSTPTTQRRQITLRPRAEYDALRQTRVLQQTDEWKERYKIRAGVEGTIAQGVQRCGMRRSRYRGLTKTSLQHQLTGAAINLARIDARLSGTGHARTRVSHFAALQQSEG